MALEKSPVGSWEKSAVSTFIKQGVSYRKLIF
jgi:hypothetical protein